MVRVLEQVAVLAEQRVVAAPGIEADAGERGCRRRARGRAASRARAGGCPSAASRRADRLVGETADVVEREDAGVEPSEDGSSALGAEIECEKVSSHVAQGGPTQHTLVHAKRKNCASAGQCFAQRNVQSVTGRRPAVSETSVERSTISGAFGEC